MANPCEKADGFKCPLCEKVCCTKGGLKRHVLAIHPESAGNPNLLSPANAIANVVAGMIKWVGKSTDSTTIPVGAFQLLKLAELQTNITRRVLILANLHRLLVMSEAREAMDKVFLDAVGRTDFTQMSIKDIMLVGTRLDRTSEASHKLVGEAENLGSASLDEAMSQAKRLAATGTDSSHPDIVPTDSRKAKVLLNALEFVERLKAKPDGGGNGSGT
jgi:hypothetical protein